MIAAFNRMASTWCFVKPIGINPGHCGGHHAKMKMIFYGIRISGLGIRTADVLFQLFERRLNLPAGAVIFNNFRYGKRQIG